MHLLTNICQYSILRESQNLENSFEEKQIYYKNQQKKSESENFEGIPTFFIVEFKIGEFSMEIIISLLENFKLPLFDLFYNFERLEKLIILSLIKTDNFLLQSRIANWFSTIFLNSLNIENSSILTILFGKILKFAIEYSERSEYFFAELIKIIQNVDKNCLKLFINIDNLIDYLIQSLKSRKILEDHVKKTDIGLIGKYYYIKITIFFRNFEHIISYI